MSDDIMNFDLPVERSSIINKIKALGPTLEALISILNELSHQKFETKGNHLF